MFELFEEQKVLRVSAGWLTQRLNCTVQHITSEGGCNGACCKGMVFWPAKHYGGTCAFLGKNGCVLPLERRPVTCNLFPIYPNKHNTMILFQRCMFAKGLCKGAFGHGEMAIDTQRAGLIDAFGQEQYDRVRASILSGHDSYFTVSEEIWEAIKYEAYCEDNNLPATPRIKYSEGAL